MPEESNPKAIAAPPSHLSTADLVSRVRRGDERARDQLFGRYLAVLTRFAHGRVPPAVRGAQDTSDVVQESLVRALKSIETFEPRRQGSFLAYLKTIVNNMIKDLGRKAMRTPRHEEYEDDVPAGDRDVLDTIVTREEFDVYLVAMKRLRPQQQDAIIHRIEKGWSYQELAEHIDCPTANAARMVVHRALARLTDEMASLQSGR
jgi:RNA polymerase sigma-70 factor (ECF subfamily)